MKKHSGGKIQAVAAVIRAVITVIASILAIFVLINMAKDDKAFLGFLIGGFIFGIGYFLGWIATCILHGFGEIVENTAETASYLRVLVARYASETMAEVTSETKEEPNPEVEENIEESVDEPVLKQTRTATFPFARSYTDQIVCPACNKLQPSINEICYFCGTEFLFEDSTEKQSTNAAIISNDNAVIAEAVSIAEVDKAQPSSATSDLPVASETEGEAAVVPEIVGTSIFCPSCGGRQSREHAFCVYCGKPLAQP